MLISKGSRRLCQLHITNPPSWTIVIAEFFIYSPEGLADLRKRKSGFLLHSVTELRVRGNRSQVHSMEIRQCFKWQMFAIILLPAAFYPTLCCDSHWPLYQTTQSCFSESQTLSKFQFPSLRGKESCDVQYKQRRLRTKKLHVRKKSNFGSLSHPLFSGLWPILILQLYCHPCLHSCNHCLNHSGPLFF